MRILATLSFILATCSFALAGGSSYNVKITSLKETAPDRYTLVFHRVPSDEVKSTPPKITLRLRHNEYCYSKEHSSRFTLDTYRKAIEELKAHAETKDIFPVGAMGGVWGIPVEGKKDEFWVQTIARVEEYDGKKVIYTFKE